MLAGSGVVIYRLCSGAVVSTEKHILIALTASSSVLSPVALTPLVIVSSVLPEVTFIPSFPALSFTVKLYLYCPSELLFDSDRL